MRNNTPRCASSSLPQSGTRHLACATCKVRCSHALSELSMHLLELFLDPRVERAHSDTPPWYAENVIPHALWTTSNVSSTAAARLLGGHSRLIAAPFQRRSSSLVDRRLADVLVAPRGCHARQKHACR